MCRFQSCIDPFSRAWYWFFKNNSSNTRWDIYMNKFCLPCCHCLVTQLCLTLCDPMNCSPLVSFVHGDSPDKNTGVVCHAVLQGIIPSQGSNPGLLQCRWVLYHLSHKGSPRTLGWGEADSLSLLQGIIPTQESNWGLPHCRQILYQLSYQGRPWISSTLLLPNKQGLPSWC